MRSTDITPQHIYAATEELKRQKASHKKPILRGFIFNMIMYPSSLQNLSGTSGWDCSTNCCLWGWAQIIAAGGKHLTDFFVDRPGDEWYTNSRDPERYELSTIMSNDLLKPFQVIKRVEAIKAKYHGEAS